MRAIATDTVAIIEQGHYLTVGGERRSIRAAVDAAVAGTRLYLPDDPLPGIAVAAVAPDTVDATPVDSPLANPAPTIEVTAESTLAACRRLIGGGDDLACLNFASARNPGGGFLRGAQAQEESITRSTALYPCLCEARGFYEFHRTHTDIIYSDRVIYSPRVPAFRDDAAVLLDEPYPVSVLTAAAPNRAMISRDQPERLDEVEPALRRRATRVLAVAAGHGHRRLVLGAWGCGVFGNDPVVVADVFAEALAARPWFDHVTFAILESRRDAPTLRAFADRFGVSVGVR